MTDATLPDNLPNTYENPAPAKREGWSPQKLNYSHTALIDQIIANPSVTNIELAKVFDRTPAWVSMVKSSGMFREAYAVRMGEIADPVLKATVEERLEMVAAKSLQVLMKKLEKPVEQIPDNLALAAAQLGAKGMGVGGFNNRPAPPPPLPTAGRIERLAERLLNLGKAGATDVGFTEIAPT